MTDNTTLTAERSPSDDDALPDDLQQQLVDSWNLLDEDAKAIPLEQRRQLAQSLTEPAAAGDEFALRLVYLLANDPEFEVRADIAQLLRVLPQSDVEALLPVLSNDANGFVQRIAENAVRRRKSKPRPRRGKREPVEENGLAQAALEKVRQQHGPRAADLAREYGEELVRDSIGRSGHNLASIIGPLEAEIRSLRKQFRGIKTRRKFDKLIGHTDYLSRLLHDMRDYARPASMDDVASVRVPELVEEAVAIVSARLPVEQFNRIELVVDVPDDIAIKVVRHYILVAIENLISNAFEAIEPDQPNGQVIVRARPLGHQVAITVADNGMGICNEELKRYREFVPGKMTKKTHGTGFGLPNAQRYIEAHRGTLTMCSEETVGTTMYVTLPSAEGVEA